MSSAREAMHEHDPAQPATARDDVEGKLDALFELHEQEQTRARQRAEAQLAQETPIDRLRNIVKTQLVEAFKQMQAKYAAKGVRMQFDPRDFLAGGRNLRIILTYCKTGIRLDGVVTHSVIAFSRTQFSESDRGGVTSSGPSLRVRDLDADAFRTFVCEQMAQLVQLVMRQRCLA